MLVKTLVFCGNDGFAEQVWRLIDLQECPLFFSKFADKAALHAEKSAAVFWADRTSAHPGKAVGVSPTAA